MAHEPDPGEEKRLQSVAWQTASVVRLVRQRAEEELARANALLEAKALELERVLRELQTEVEVTQVLVNASTIEEVIDTILGLLCRNLSWSCAHLWRFDRQAHVLRRTAGWCDSSLSAAQFNALADFAEMPPGIGLPGRIWEARQPIWIVAIDNDPNFPRAPLARSIGLKSAFGFPLIVSGAVLGVIELFSRQRRPVDGSLLKLAATLGSHIGQFIKREVAEADQRRAFIQIRRLQEVTETALANLPMQQMFENLLAKVCETVNADLAVVFLLDPKGDELEAVATYGPNSHTLAQHRLRVGESLAGRVASERQLRVVRNAAHDPTLQLALRALGVRTVLAIPLVARGKLTGVLKVGALADRDFGPADTDFIQAVGRQVALAIENSTLYESAREANRIKDRFLSIASHELRTPLNALLGWTEILRTIDREDLRDRALEAIEQSARTQAELIEGLLDASRIREGKLVLQPEPVDLREVVEGALRTLQPNANQQGVILQTEVPVRPVIAMVDPNRMRQVLWNLLSNAIKFTPPARSVRMSLRSDDATATITVEDEGDGIDPQFLPRIFNALEQDEKGVRAGGLGLGLHIVKSIVELHHGKIEAFSAGLGRGARFVVTLPLRPTEM